MDDFRDRAACVDVDPELFFPVNHHGEDRAKAICQGCPVAAPCLAEALERGHDGIWGGKTLEERRALRQTVPQ